MTDPGIPARLLTIMGSGETSPTMVKVHRSILARLGPPPVPSVLLDTPFGFQENAAEIAGRVVSYFRDSLQTEIGVASLRMGDGDCGEWDSFGEEQLVTRVKTARYVFSGPGSPTYALNKWEQSVVPQMLAEKLEHGGAVTFASAAALTLGVATVPVYEIYKVGQPPHWLDGLNLLSLAGVEAAVIPHYNNAEGGTHDTRFCYLGERRLSLMERELPNGAFVLGIDEHTSVTFDLAAGSATVAGLGGVTVRGRGESARYESGVAVSVAELVATGRALTSGGAGPRPGRAADTAPVPSRQDDGAAAVSAPGNPLLEIVLEKERTFKGAIEQRAVVGAVTALLELEQALIDWSKDIPGDDTLDRARASFRSMLVELGRLAETGSTDPAEVVGPFVEALLSARKRARTERRYDESDLLRDALVELGIEVRDTPDGAEWSLREVSP